VGELMGRSTAVGKRSVGEGADAKKGVNGVVSPTTVAVVCLKRLENKNPALPFLSKELLLKVGEAENVGILLKKEPYLLPIKLGVVLVEG